jgi:tetratricopeptide (TPR) repeat protein
MKKLLLFIPLMLIFALNIQAQEMSKDTKKELKSAERDLNGFKVNNSAKDKLMDAVKGIDAVMEKPDAQNVPDTWLAMGDIYNEVATQYIAIKQLGIGSTEGLPDPNGKALAAMNAYNKGLELSDKGSDQKKALQGIRATQNNMSQLGVYQYEAGEYDAAFNSFNGVIRAHDVLKENGEDSALGNDDDFNNQLYITGLAAMNANKMPSAAVYFQKLYEINYDKPLVYEAMYKIKSADDSEAAYQYLEKGRELYPEDMGLLFAEINYFLRAGKKEVLVEKLKTAIEKESNNKSLYFTLGNVYDQFFQQAVQDTNKVNEQKYYELALQQYDEALKIDPDYVDAVYGKGALHYNKAANLTKELQVLSDDYSADGIKKYEAKKAEVFKEFDAALPFFKKAESINPNDINTLIALKEIYARKDDLEKSNEFKKRLETVQAGGKNESSYFNN